MPRGGQERPGWQVRISPAVTGPDGHLAEDRVPSGGGVYVGGRWVLTCAHVIGPEPQTVMARFSFAAGEPVPATVAPQGWLPGNQGDLALLELDRDPPPGARPAPLRPARADQARLRRLRLSGPASQYPMITAPGARATVSDGTASWGQGAVADTRTRSRRGALEAVWDEASDPYRGYPRRRLIAAMSRMTSAACAG